MKRDDWIGIFWGAAIVADIGFSLVNWRYGLIFGGLLCAWIAYRVVGITPIAPGSEGE
jgi:short subunit fatty acids transporter